MKSTDTILYSLLNIYKFYVICVYQKNQNRFFKLKFIYSINMCRYICYRNVGIIINILEKQNNLWEKIIIIYDKKIINEKKKYIYIKINVHRFVRMYHILGPYNFHVHGQYVWAWAWYFRMTFPGHPVFFSLFFSPVFIVVCPCLWFKVVFFYRFLRALPFGVWPCFSRK